MQNSLHNIRAINSGSTELLSVISCPKIYMYKARGHLNIHKPRSDFGILIYNGK